MAYEETRRLLKGRGYRMTKVRDFLLRTFSATKTPLSAPELLARLTKQRLSANKTTIYRELEFLTQQNIIQSIDFGDGKKRYEASTDEHHHHLVCTSCGRVVDVELRGGFEREAARLQRETGFKIASHSLEFFGTCKECL